MTSSFARISQAIEFPRRRRRQRLLAVCLLAAAAVVGGCGGGGTQPAQAGTTMMSGTAVKGPVAGATVTAFAIANGSRGQQVGTGTTDQDGHFTLSAGSYAGPVLVEMAGGTYVDEATGASTAMQAGTTLTAVIPSVAAGSATTGIQVTPLTTMAQARAQNMAGGMTDANIGAANGAMGDYFAVNDILHTSPMNPLVAGSGAGATQDMRNYGMALAAMSQYAKDVGMTTSSGVVTMLARDASDGVMNGMSGTAPVGMAGMGGMSAGTMSATAGGAGLATAMAEFAGSAMNRSGVAVAAVQALIDKLSGTTGQLPAGSGGTTPAPGGGTASGMMSGVAFMGSVASGTVTALPVADDGTVGAAVATAAVDATGAFTLPMGTYAGRVMLRLSGASYTDEATGSTMAMLPDGVMTAALPAVTAGASTTGLCITPLTSMAQLFAQGMPGGMTDANVTAANAAVGSYFAVNDVVHTMPMDPALAGSGAGASQDARDYGLTIAAMSQYAATVGMTTSAGMFTAMMDDASDGIMNGMMGSAAISMTGMGSGMGGGMMGGGGTMMQATAGTTGLATAMSQFVGSAMNRSGVGAADVQPLLSKLGSSSGILQ